MIIKTLGTYAYCINRVNLGLNAAVLDETHHSRAIKLTWLLDDN